MTADHVLSKVAYDTLRIRFSDQGTEDGIRLDVTTVNNSVSFRSPEQELDLAILKLSEPELERRYRFTISDKPPLVGTQVIVFGYPYNSHVLTSHVGYVSAAYSEETAEVLQLDASVNPSNSGGPVVNATTGEVIGYVTRAQTGLLRDFDNLIAALESNVTALSAPVGASISIGGLDPRQAFLVTMNALGQLALNMRRSANVGIGYAFSAKHIQDARTR